MNNWGIKDIAITVGSGITPLRSNAEYWNNGKYPWLKTEQLGEFEIYDTYEYISQIALEQTSIRLWPPKTISVAMYGEGKTRGSVSIIMQEMATNQACCNIVVDPAKAEYLFVYYWLKNNYEQLRSLSSGVRKNLNADDIKNFSIKKMLLPVQEKLSTVLFLIDQKIQLNSRIITELEEMAKTIYDYWFVQFDFPDTNGKPYRTSGGAMEYNEQLKREIPKGWCANRLGIIESNIVTGKTPSTKEIDNFGNDVPFITIDDIRNNTYIVKTTRSLSNKGADSQASKFLPPNSICITCIASPGLIGITTERSQTNQQINAVICKKKSTVPYLYLLLSHYFSNAIGAKTGNVFANMSKGDLSSILLLSPDKDIVNNFSLYTSPMFNKIKTLSLENFELATLRDWLLPLLMNGQATVE